MQIIPTKKGFFEMKKIIAIILAAAAILTVFCSCGKKESEPVTSGDYTYVVLEDNTAKITKYNSAEEIVTLDIPSSIDDYTVSIIGSEAFAGVSTIKVVNFPETLVKIEPNAFTGSSIKKAFLHKSRLLTEIGELAFSECHNLVQVDLPSSLTALGDKAFYYCDSLKVATFRGDTPNIPALTFDACRNVKIYTKESCQHVIDFAKSYNIETVITGK